VVWGSSNRWDDQPRRARTVEFSLLSIRARNALEAAHQIHLKHVSQKFAEGLLETKRRFKRKNIDCQVMPKWS
jgi:hypothetical protein